MSQQTEISYDDETTPREQNRQLSILINGHWNRLEIIKIERKINGWEVTYHDND